MEGFTMRVSCVLLLLVAGAMPAGQHDAAAAVAVAAAVAAHCRPAAPVARQPEYYAPAATHAQAAGVVYPAWSYPPPVPQYYQPSPWAAQPWAGQASFMPAFGGGGGGCPGGVCGR
jgi:hypothetical protein